MLSQPQPESASESTTGTFTAQLRAAAMAANTRRAYRKGWELFCAWCARRPMQPHAATPSDVEAFFIELADTPHKITGKPLQYSTLLLHRCAITRRFTDAGLASPTHHPDVLAVFRGLARLRGTAPSYRAGALRENHIAAMLHHCPSTVIGMRDAAVIALGFAAAMRRSELCALQLGDVTWHSRDGKRIGIRLHIRRSKTDQAGVGQFVAIPEGKHIRPVYHLQRWLDAAKLPAADAPLLQSMRRGGRLTGRALDHSDITRLVKHYAEQIGLDPTNFSAHSLRAGFVTSAAAHHARLDKIMAVTRHSQASTVMKYIRDADAFCEHAGAGFL